MYMTGGEMGIITLNSKQAIDTTNYLQLTRNKDFSFPFYFPLR